MKSAYELAMERLQKTAPSVVLTAEQKAQLAEIDSQFRARSAERELFLKSEIAKAQMSGNVEEVEQLRHQLATDLRRLGEDCEAKKRKGAAVVCKLTTVPRSSIWRLAIRRAPDR